MVVDSYAKFFFDLRNENRFWYSTVTYEYFYDVYLS